MMPERGLLEPHRRRGRVEARRVDDVGPADELVEVVGAPAEPLRERAGDEPGAARRGRVPELLAERSASNAARSSGVGNALAW